MFIILNKLNIDKVCLCESDCVLILGFVDCHCAVSVANMVNERSFQHLNLYMHNLWWERIRALSAVKNTRENK
jgi:hypothetical protein